VYIIAEYLGGAIAAILALMLYGPGPELSGGHEADLLAVQMAAPSQDRLASGNKQERAGLINVAASSGAPGSQATWNARFERV